GQVVSPVRPPFGTFLHPPGEHVDFFIAQWRRVVGHAQLRVGFREPLDKITVRRIATPDGPLARLRGGKSLILEQQAEAAVLLHPPMAADAMLIDDGFYIGTEINALLLPQAKHPDEQDSRADCTINAYFFQHLTILLFTG